MKKLFYLFCIVTILQLSLTVFAEDTASRKSLSKRSKSGNVLGESVNGLIKKRGIGNETVFEYLYTTLIKKNLINLSKSNEINIHQEENSETIQAWGDGWNLSVSSDGTIVNFYNWKKRENSTERGIIHSKINVKQLEKLGRNFIKNNISDYLKLAKNEKLVAFKSSYEIDGQADAFEQNFVESVEANTIVFSRKVNGIDVLGAGSKVAIIFNYNQEPIGFRINWPTYKRSDIQFNIVSNREIAERASSYNSALTTGTISRIKRFECGYFDNGKVSAKGLSLIQPACVVFYSQEGDMGKSAYIDAIPAALKPQSDPDWLQSEILKEQGDVCFKTKLTDAMLDYLELR